MIQIGRIRCASLNCPPFLANGCMKPVQLAGRPLFPILASPDRIESTENLPSIHSLHLYLYSMLVRPGVACWACLEYMDATSRRLPWPHVHPPLPTPARDGSKDVALARTPFSLATYFVLVPYSYIEVIRKYVILGNDFWPRWCCDSRPPRCAALHGDGGTLPGTTRHRHDTSTTLLLYSCTGVCYGSTGRSGTR